jgi:mono/diheme cytochrome c family protein
MAAFSRISLAFALGLALAVAAGCKRTSAQGDTQAEAKHLFDSVCAKCHGSDGRGGVPSAEGLPAPSNFTDPAFHASRSEADLRNAIKNGKGPMPPFGALFDETQTTLLVSYIRAFNAKKQP